MADKNVDTRNPEPFELVGGTDLREVFKDGQRARGTFYLNGVEMHQFDANSPASVVTQINAKSALHFLTAEIDDGGHLVLVDRSGAEPVIRAGAPWEDPPPVSTGDAMRDAINVQTHIAERAADKAEKKKNILELLGLPAVKDDPKAGIVQPGFETGLSAADRKERYKRERMERDGVAVNPTTATGSHVGMATQAHQAETGGAPAAAQRPTHR